VLVVSYIYHWEHHVTLPFTPRNTDFWSVVLSASLQAFYTLYTAVLVFLTQRLAMSRALVRRLKLTSIHDISGTWAGIGSALSSVWKQTGTPALLWSTVAVTAYLVCISVLHVTSSTLLQFQTFNSTMTTNVSTTLGWTDIVWVTYVDFEDMNWGAITASLPVINRFPGVVSAGLSNNTVYDTLQTSSVVGHAMVNATVVTSSCGLLPNVTYTRNNSEAIAPYGNGNYVSMTAPPPWTNQIQLLHITATEAVQVNESSPVQNFPLPSVLLMVSTLLEIDPSVQKEVAVPMIWDYASAFGFCNMVTIANLSAAENQPIEVYFVQCSLSTSNTTVVIDTQTGALQNPMPVPQPSTLWEEMHQSTSNDSSWSEAIGQIMAMSGGSSYKFTSAIGNTCEPSVVDEYIMSLVGLSLPSQYLQSIRGQFEPPVANFTLRPDQLEVAIAKTAAQLMWMAGRMGSDGAIQPGEGMALVSENVIALRLNITFLPLLFATSASVIMLGLALHTTRAFGASHSSRAFVSNTGVLQFLWLGYYSASVHDALQDVEHPTEDNLRRAGMIDVCFASTTSDEELPMRSLIDNSLSV
ncbi:hypothetical protein P692DRAFT_20841016, partial [Suillus brevipes Sb2]